MRKSLKIGGERMSKDIRDLINKLPPDLRGEVEDFIMFLLEKRKKKRVKLSQNWAGKLRDYRDQYTSIELQKKAIEWRE